MNFFSDNENFERGPPRHAGGNGNQGINFVWPNNYYKIIIIIHMYIKTITKQTKRILVIKT